jgi:hypothetical protein
MTAMQVHVMRITQEVAQGVSRPEIMILMRVYRPNSYSNFSCSVCSTLSAGRRKEVRMESRVMRLRIVEWKTIPLCETPTPLVFTNRRKVAEECKKTLPWASDHLVRAMCRRLLPGLVRNEYVNAAQNIILLVTWIFA